MEPQDCNFLSRNLKHEVLWEPRDVSRHRFIEFLSHHPVKLSEMGIEHDPLLPENQNPRFDWDDFLFGHGRNLPAQVGSLESQTPSSARTIFTPATMFASFCRAAQRAV